MKSAIHIGTDAEKLSKALPDITKNIINILNTTAGDDVKKCAIEALTKAFSVNNINLSDVHIENKEGNKND